MWDRCKILPSALHILCPPSFSNLKFCNISTVLPSQEGLPTGLRIMANFIPTIKAQREDNSLPPCLYADESGKKYTADSVQLCQPFRRERIRFALRCSEDMHKCNRCTDLIFRCYQGQFFCPTDGLLVFREFLQGEFSDENLEFWIACQKYKALTDESLQRLRAQEIYDGFIAFQSQREVS